MPKPLTTMLLAINAILALLGLASIVDGFVVWVGFLRDFLDLYETFFRGPIKSFVNAITPDVIPDIPNWVYDIIIIWTSSFLVFRIFVYLEKDHNYIIPLHLRRRSKLYAIMLLLGPLGPFYLRGYSSGRWGEERKTTLAEMEADRKENLLNELGKMALRKRLEAVDETKAAVDRIHTSMTYYYAAAVVVFVMILFINYQITILD